jgi:hypothetical protein
LILSELNDGEPVGKTLDRGPALNPLPGFGPARRLFRAVSIRLDQPNGRLAHPAKREDTESHRPCRPIAGSFKKEHAMFESTGEMIVSLVLFFAMVFPFVYLGLKGRKQKSPPDLPQETVQDHTIPDITTRGHKRKAA